MKPRAWNERRQGFKPLFAYAQQIRAPFESHDLGGASTCVAWERQVSASVSDSAHFWCSSAHLTLAAEFQGANL